MIESIEGDVPGNAKLTIRIPYLSKMFGEHEETIELHLANCRKLALKIWEGEILTEDPNAILNAKFEILSTESPDTPVSLITTVGEFKIDYDDFSISLIDGTPVSFEQISQTCDKYWSDWEAKAKQA